MSAAKPTVAILGASTDRKKYGNKSVRAHVQQGYDVFPVNPTAAEVEGLKAYPRLADVPAERLDRISVYLPPQLGITVLDQIAAKHPKEVWFNPGSESPELIEKAEALGLPVIMACSIVDLGSRPSDLSDQ
ncbi:MAG: CoA-binding protein [Planctomycetaceae bacterium]